MHRPLAVLALSALSLASVSMPAVALADVPPPDTCSKPDAPCRNAGPKYDQAGTCKASKCSKMLPSPDGGLAKHEYDCNTCVASDATAASSAAGSSTTPPPKKGCSMTPGRVSGFGGAAAALALGCLIVGRRRARGR